MNLKKMKPEQSEGKQDFLKRCAAEVGGSETEAMAMCTASWNKSRLAALVDERKLTLTGGVELVQLAAGETPDAPRRFQVLAHTGKVIDLGWWGKFVIDLSGITMAKSKTPALLSHRTDQIVGTIDTSSRDANGFYVFGAFSKASQYGRETLALADEGFPWQASIGVQARKVLQVKEGETHEVNGMTVEGPIDVWLQSTVFETSFCAFGADDDTAAIAMSATAINQQEDSMNERLRKFLESRGLAANATDQEAWAYLEKLNVNNDELTQAGLTAEDVKPQAELAATRPAPVAPAAPAQPVQAARELSGAQVLVLTSAGATLGLTHEQITRAIQGQTSEDKAMLALYEAAREANPPLGAGRIEMGADERDKFRLAAVSGVCARMGLREDKPAAGFEEFRALSLHEMARLTLERSGVVTKGLTRHQLAQEVIRLSASGVSTSDFSSIFMDAAHRTLLRAYQEAPATWRPLVNVVPASDFKTIHGISLSEAPDLDLVGENGEYKTGHLSDKQESYSVGKYGKILSLTLEMIVNDDLRAFGRIPQLLGSAARRKVADMVYGLITGNPKMADGKNVFSSDHANLEATTKGTITGDRLTAGRVAMRKQKGMKGSTLDIHPAFLLVPVAQETAAEVLLRSTALPETTMSAGVHNPWAGKLQPIADPRLDAASPEAWYLFGDPSQVDTIEVAFLDGNEEPTLTENDEFVRDAVSYKVRHIFGAGWIDHRGAYRNPGK
ncbi:Mu-like prophage major head subunit gpT family protein [Pseudodesulfovibrio pelocollis]|uniref:phage major capsid protein n=1 Tax=Pseudodesulfovibrio pelocollis TaxID=3051432 RepID=UPI00255AD7D1|nr:Mu-like prophage major head subunit gpT family protein [Pseudodesulfovibrio sp. SB368]